MKKLLAILLVAALMCSGFAACGKTLTADEAYQVVLTDLGDEADHAGEPHIHTGDFNGIQCYNIYVTVDGENYFYAVSMGGTILSKGTGAAHSH